MADTIKSMPSPARLKFQNRLDKVKELFFAAAGVCVFLLPATIPEDDPKASQTLDDETREAAMWLERQGCDPQPLYRGEVPDCSDIPDTSGSSEIPTVD
ncbi:MAG: hypothetical protein ACRBDL_00280 [Alphaproteobacteria bacterium]